MNSHVRLRRSRAQRTRGAEMLEFTLVFAPMMAMVLVLVDIGWVVFAKATLQYAVRSGVRAGITITGTQAAAAGSDLTTMVKHTVQARALGLLNGASGLEKIKVHYYKPPESGSTGPAVDVSNQANGNSQLNIMQVSVEGYSLSPLVGRMYSLKQTLDKTPTTITAIAADLIEPSRDLPPIGVAP